MNQPALLSWIIFTPWIGAFLVFVFRRALSPQLARLLPALFSLSTLILGGIALARFDPTVTGLQFVEKCDWIRALNVHYHVGLDGLSLVLVLLTGILSPLALFGTTRSLRCPAIHGALFLLLQGSALGVFLALDFFPWFVFWELSLVPAFFLIKLWGGPGASRAAYQFVVYTIGGSAFMLLGFAALYAATGTFDFIELAALARAGLIAEKLALVGGIWPQAVFLGVLLGLAVKVPLFPFHAWLPPTYAEAPTGTSMFLTGVMSKMGVYGFLRILWPLFPAPLHAAATPLLWLALAGVVLSAFAAMKQTDLKRLVAYSSINHLSYCLLALFAVAAAGPANPAAATAALSGTILQVFNHGLSAAALFFCVGVLESRSSGSRGLHDFGGVRSAAPVFAGFCGVALFSSLGLPGLNGFVGEFLIFRGVFGLAPWAAAIATLGLLATALFLLTFWQRVFHGPAAGAGIGFRDLDAGEIVTLLPLLVLMFALGLFPQLLTGLINPLVTSWAATLP
ncbi:NAD(P)H-quinone oxidoreductase chain 4 1 [Lacunisphaera limnophila]|uniref:NAD(P)H-quinone oxidoreductase chain 4 1 n=1 Tax=Lacunisphaera limnophila TaxID=1838286 RepID=A0A1D8AVB0_9BACT|nr:NADH-quinone oxidoreductase subunit M [Lacunisphaera limnophila]AOS44795.1 NAD(P)H-quinone oxidoreductase chain 4 1 [Lacunisphaera limnophila]